MLLSEPKNTSIQLTSTLPLLALLTFVLAFFSVNLYAFTEKECLDESFTNKIIHKAMPFGLTKTLLSFNKNLCDIKISHRKFKFMKKQWEIDVCRTPVHIKTGTDLIEVVKKGNSFCSSGATSEYCNTYKELIEIIQDDGLIFAKGEKEDLQSDHGKVYCIYTILESYLNSGTILTRHPPTNPPADPEERSLPTSPTIMPTNNQAREENTPEIIPTSVPTAPLSGEF